MIERRHSTRGHYTSRRGEPVSNFISKFRVDEEREAKSQFYTRRNAIGHSAVARIWKEAPWNFPNGLWLTHAPASTCTFPENRSPVRSRESSLRDTINIFGVAISGLCGRRGGRDQLIGGGFKAREPGELITRSGIDRHGRRARSEACLAEDASAIHAL